MAKVQSPTTINDSASREQKSVPLILPRVEMDCRKCYLVGLVWFYFVVSANCETTGVVNRLLASTVVSPLQSGIRSCISLRSIGSSLSKCSAITLLLFFFSAFCTFVDEWGMSFPDTSSEGGLEDADHSWSNKRKS